MSEFFRLSKQHRTVPCKASTTWQLWRIHECVFLQIALKAMLSPVNKINEKKKYSDRKRQFSANCWYFFSALLPWNCPALCLLEPRNSSTYSNKCFVTLCLLPVCLWHNARWLVTETTRTFSVKSRKFEKKLLNIYLNDNVSRLWKDL